MQGKVGKLDKVVSELRLQRSSRARGGRGRLARRQIKDSTSTGAIMGVVEGYDVETGLGRDARVCVCVLVC